MNEVFIIGIIQTEIEFKFIVNSKNKFSKVTFKIQTLDKQEIKVIGYNNIADYALKYLKRNDMMFIYGRLNSDMRLEIEYCKLFYSKESALSKCKEVAY